MKSLELPRKCHIVPVSTEAGGWLISVLELAFQHALCHALFVRQSGQSYTKIT